MPESVDNHHPATLPDCILIMGIACPLQKIRIRKAHNRKYTQPKA